MGNAIKTKIVGQWKHVRNLRHFDSAFLQSRCLRIANTYTHQQWGNVYPQSHVLSEDYPFQVILDFGEPGVFLALNSSPMFINGDGRLDVEGAMAVGYDLNGNDWSNSGAGWIDLPRSAIVRSNHEIKYLSSGLVYFNLTDLPSDVYPVFDVRCNI